MPASNRRPFTTDKAGDYRITDLSVEDRQKVKALMLDLDLADAREVFLMAVRQLYEREIQDTPLENLIEWSEQPTRAEFDELVARVKALEAR